MKGIGTPIVFNKIANNWMHWLPVAIGKLFRLRARASKKVLHDQCAGEVAEQDHTEWYQKVFAPNVVSGIIQASDLAGYRNQSVYIRGSMHTPPSVVAMRELMPVFFDLLRAETHPAVRVVLGHFVFVYIHLYSDGNGRIGRFLMNLMLIAGGYPWTIIPIGEHNPYMAALEQASVHQDIVPFAQFIAQQMGAIPTHHR